MHVPKMIAYTALMAVCLFGSATQALAALARITDQPDSRTVEWGKTAAFHVSFRSDSNTRFQWRLNRQPIPGATGPSYIINKVKAIDAGSYDLVIRNASGSVVSKTAVLTVPKAPKTLPQGLVLYANLTYRILGTSEAVDGALVVNSSNTLIDPESPENRYTFTYERLSATTAVLKTTLRFYDEDLGTTIRVNETYKLTFTKLTSVGDRIATCSSSGVIIAPPGYSPERISFTSTGKLSFEREVAASGGTGSAIPSASITPPSTDTGGIDITIVVAPSS